MNTSLGDADIASLFQIAGEVADLAQDVQARRTHILNRLLELIGGCLAVCSEVDPNPSNEDGWASPNSMTCSGDMSSEAQARVDLYIRGELAALDPCVPPLLRNENAVATVRREDVVDHSSWFRSEHFIVMRRPFGVGESLYGKLITPDGRRLKLTLHREMNDSPFTERHVQLMQVFNENLASLYITRPRADPRIGSLPPRLRPVLQRLLAGDAEKQAALKLGLSQNTVHQYTKLLYRTFGVNSRGELLAQFVTAAPV